MYDVLWIFFIYAFLGWCMEVIYATTDTGKFINRGFLIGPACPIYGIGMVIVVSVLSSIQDNIFILFIGAMILTSILEFITGVILERIFNDKWWDYSDLPFNIKGYICLKFSILWGLGCVFIMKLIYPLTDKFIGMIPRTLGILLLCILSVTIITDFIITLINVLKLPKRINRLVDIENKLNDISVSIGKELSENTLSVQEKRIEIEKSIKEKVAKQEELKEKYRKLLLENNFIQKRLLNAFPRIKNGRYKEVVKKILENREKRK